MDGGLQLERLGTPSWGYGIGPPASYRSHKSTKSSRSLKQQTVSSGNGPLHFSSEPSSFLPPIGTTTWLTGHSLAGKPKQIVMQPAAAAARAPALRASRTVSGIPLQPEWEKSQATLAASRSTPAVVASASRDSPDLAAVTLSGRGLFPRRRRSGRRRRGSRSRALARLSEDLVQEEAYEEDYEAYVSSGGEHDPQMDGRPPHDPRRRASLPHDGGSTPDQRPRPSAASPPPPPSPAAERAGAPRVRLDELRLLRPIGAGGSSTVYEGEFRGQRVAVKRFLYRGGGGFTEEEVGRFRAEALAMEGLDHPNVVRLVAVCEDRRSLALALTLCPGGSLDAALPIEPPTPPPEGERAPPPPASALLGRLDAARVRRLALDVARGLAYLHNRPTPIVHRDLKTSNLFLDASGTVLIGDFGTASAVPHARLMTETGTLAVTLAPEVLRAEPADEKVDVYGFGMALYEMVFRRRPYDDVRELNALALGMAAAFDGLRPSLARCPVPALAPLIRDCWHPDPARRPSSADLVRFLEALPADTPPSDPYDRDSDGFEPASPYPPSSRGAL